MGCSQTLSGLVKDCSPNNGGIVEVYLANFADVTAKTLTDGKISAITMASGASFKKYQFPKNTGSLTSTYNVGDGDSKYVASDLLMQFGRMETSKRVEVVAMALSDLVAIVKDRNGIFWYLGYDEPVTLADGSNGQTGTQRSDLNRYEVTLHDESSELPYEVLPSVVEGLLAQ
jgi:hypothetical protein